MAQLNRSRTKMQYEREFLRVNLRDSVSISRDDEYYIDYPIDDISGGGISFKTDHPEFFAVNDRVKGMVFIQRQPVTFYGKIVRITDNRISVKYILINETSRCKIIQECYRQQLKNKK